MTMIDAARTIRKENARMTHKPRPRPAAMPVDYDLGPGTPLAKVATVVEAVPEDVNGRKRRRRQQPWEYAPLREALDAAQADAANALSEAWEGTMRSPPAIQEIRVDSTMDPTACIAMQVAAASEFASLYCAVPGPSRPVVDHVVLRGLAIRDGFARGSWDGRKAVESLQAGLAKVAARMRRK